MPPDTLTTTDAFTEALDRLQVTWARTPPGGLADALRAAIEPPAVGAAGLREAFGLEDDLGIEWQPTVGQLRAAQTGVTAAALGVADYGSIVIENAPDGTEPVSLFPKKHVAVLRAEAIVPDMPAAFRWLAEALRSAPPEAPPGFVLATGPSATADMGALVRGAHGPKTVHVIIVEG